MAKFTDEEESNQEEKKIPTASAYLVEVTARQRQLKLKGVRN